MTTGAAAAAARFSAPSTWTSGPRVAIASVAFVAARRASRDPIVTWWPALARGQVRPNPPAPVPPMIATSIGTSLAGSLRHRDHGDRSDRAARRRRVHRHRGAVLAPGFGDVPRHERRAG